jgi:hypothetical protein
MKYAFNLDRDEAVSWFALADHVPMAIEYGFVLAEPTLHRVGARGLRQGLQESSLLRSKSALGDGESRCGI